MLTITHHPGDDTILRYAAGTLNEGPSLVVATHLSLCQTCRHRTRKFEMLGGDLLESLPLSGMSPDALSSTLARLDGDSDLPLEGPSPLRTRSRPDLPPGTAWPDVLSYYDIGQWKQIAPGAVWSAVEIPGQSKGQVRLLRVAAGAALPAHGHDGPEYTCVLAGSYADHSGRFAAGTWPKPIRRSTISSLPLPTRSACASLRWKPSFACTRDNFKVQGAKFKVQSVKGRSSEVQRKC